MQTNTDRDRQATFFNLMRTRRVTRQFADTPVSREQIEQILESARWAPSGGNRRLNLYIVLQDPVMIRRIRAISPGMLPVPPAIILICLDTAKAVSLGFRYWEQASAYVDLGTALENMLLTAHALGLGACPMMSFHRPAAQLLLDLPKSLVPEVMVLLGEPASPRRVRSRPVDINEFTYWERYEPNGAERG